jgi:hypothetical protein
VSVRVALVALAFVLGIAAAACTGDDEESDNPPPTTTQAAPKPPASPSEALIQFLTAIENENDARAWQLVSEATIRAFNYNPRHFELNIAPALRQELRVDPRITFSERFAGGHALVVLTDAMAGGGPFAATLRGEDGGWRIQLFYPQFVATRPQETETLRAGRQQLIFDVVRRRQRKVNVRLWLDGQPVRLRLNHSANFVNAYTGVANLRRGEHTLIAHAITDEGLSGAYAWRFTAR